MSSAEYFDDGMAINPFMDKTVPIDRERAQTEHDLIQQALKGAGVEVITVPAPRNCQDGVYTANWALVRNGVAVRSNLPNARQDEEYWAEKYLRELGLEVHTLDDNIRFSGQGDALPCGNYLFMGSKYRTDRAAHDIIREKLSYEVISLQAKPLTNWAGRQVINEDSGWPDSFYYDIDLALSVLRGPGTNGEKGLIAWCPDAFTRESRHFLRDFDGVEKILVSEKEAKRAFACNLVSTGETVVMSAHAPKFQSELEKRGFTVVTPEISELAKGGGYIRCTTLTLDNK